MDSSSKDRMKISIILGVPLLGLFGMWYLFFGNHKATGTYTSAVKVVKEGNLQQIELCKKYNTPYAVKLEENNEFYLEFHEINMAVEGKVDITTDKYNKLVEGKDYWFKIKYTKEKTKGIVEKIYNDRPVK